MIGARVLPLWATGFCVAGLLGLHLPLVDGIGDLDLTVRSVPGFGVTITVLFLALTALPIADLVAGRVRLIPLLLVPAALGLIPAVVIASTVMSFVDASEAVSGLLPVAGLAVDVGSGAVLLALADLGLVVVGVLALLPSWRSPAVGPSDMPPSSGGLSAPARDDDL